VSQPALCHDSGVERRRIRVDMHTHCEYSFDSQTPLEEQANAIRAAGLDAVCATDHDTIEGALRLREIADGFRVIVGEEINSRDGEVIGLFLERAVPADLSAEDTIGRIKEQGGLVVVPHPFSPSRPQHLRRETLERLWPQIDAIEVLNGRQAFPSDNEKAVAFARGRRIPGTAGSDAHQSSEIGLAFVELPDFVTAVELRDALASGTVHRRSTNVAAQLLTRLGVGRGARHGS
jgi:predicted metal-dependent phosphoesterase TrpH